mmetsp:Transcript_85734/g.228537  ORF Transcript_85734/g.228537 Transcript_85734/m.228537 type:complete len:371 (-) Transcript_85734:537-1649(-)
MHAEAAEPGGARRRGRRRARRALPPVRGAPPRRTPPQGYPPRHPGPQVRPGADGVGVQEQGGADPAQRGARLPAQPAGAAELRAGRGPGGEGGAGADQARRAAGGLRLQAAGEPVWPAHLPPRLPGHPPQGRDGAARVVGQEDQGAAAGAHALGRDAGRGPRQGRRHRGALRRRVRHGRHLHRRQDAPHHDVDARAVARHVAGAAPQEEGPAGQVLQGAQPLHARGPHLPRGLRRGDEADHRVGHGRAAPANLRGAHPARVRGGVRGGRAARQLPRDGDAQGHLRLPAQEAERRAGPVRPHHGLHRAHGDGHGPDPVREPHDRQRHLALVDGRRREGLPRGLPGGPPHRPPGVRLPLRGQRRRVARGRLE